MTQIPYTSNFLNYSKYILSQNLLKPLFQSKKFFMSLLLSVILTGTGIGIAPTSFSQEKGKPVMPVIVAITQIGEHPSLNQERNAILEALKKAGYREGEHLTILYENAQGSLTIGTQIAAKFASVHPTVMVAISTPSAQSLLPIVSREGIPLVFTAVTDPEGARLTSDPSLEITGVSDAMDPLSLIELMQKMLPQLKTLGTLYNPSEVNSTRSVNQLKQYAEQLGIELIIRTASNTRDVKMAAESLVAEGIQAFVILNDNTAVSAMPTIVAVAENNHLPVFAADMGSLEQGAAAGMVYDRSDLGTKAGEMVVQILQGVSAKSIPIAVKHMPFLMINMKTAQSQGLSMNTIDKNTYPKAVFLEADFEQKIEKAGVK